MMTGEPKLLPTEEKSQLELRKGKIALRYRKIAYLASKGLTAKAIGQEVNLSEDRVRKILARPDVWDESKKLMKESFEGSERAMVNLLDHALRALENKILFGTPDEQNFAIEKVLRFFQASKGEGGEGKTFITQFFSGVKGSDPQDQGSRLDEIVRQKRIERGLPEFPDED